jgi:hypothetical protein
MSIQDEEEDIVLVSVGCCSMVVAVAVEVAVARRARRDERRGALLLLLLAATAFSPALLLSTLAKRDPVQNTHGSSSVLSQCRIDRQHTTDDSRESDRNKISLCIRIGLSFVFKSWKTTGFPKHK